MIRLIQWGKTISSETIDISNKFRIPNVGFFRAAILKRPPKESRKWEILIQN